ncbi:peptide ABC transporter substrate-binding protein [Moraxella ovis]|uniref:Peptide ABC transporter substrate-binding protein n=2 Tax=Moraxella ovis TaxID=29433 RepID=A0ABN4PN73_9GAMM|nr:ABC transporter substrate-binding protein [Moraxella ovis]ANB91166.1 peptide ABC transporter substrate-binding protein [Moraxella ovis]
MTHIFSNNKLAWTLIMALMLAACDGRSAITNDADTAKQVITINNASEPQTLDPQLAQGVQELNIIRQFGMGLVQADADGKIVPAVASEWANTDDKVWVFKLRHDAKWSNGEPLTADDFVYAFRRLVDPNLGSPYASYLEDAKIVNAKDIIAGKKPVDTLGVEAIDEHTLQITLSEVVPYLPDMMIHSTLVPVHQKTVESFGEKWTDPKHIVVNGAFKPTDWTVNEKIVLEKNPHFYDNASNQLDRLVVLPISSATTDVQRYQAGEVDITASELPKEQFDTFKHRLGDELKTAAILCTYYYDLNHAKKPFNDPRVRLALAMTLDREIITDKVLGQGQIPAYQFTPLAIKDAVSHAPKWQAWNKTKRIETAKQLLAQAGYDETHPLQFELLYDTNEQHKKIAIAAAALWKQALGVVEIHLTNQEWKTYLDARRTGNFQMVRARWCGDYNEASTFLNLRKSDNSNNWSGYANATYDELMLQTLDPKLTAKQRTALYDQAEKMMAEDSTQINVLFYANVQLVKPYIKGFSNADPLNLWQARRWSVKK